MTFGLGTACLAIAACLLMPTYYVNPRAGNAFVLVAFTIVVLGGMGSVAGALVGGLFVGVVESLSGLYLGESLGQIGIFVMFILVLLFRPSGLVRRAGMKGFAPILVAVAAARARAADHVVERRAQFPGDGAADRAGRPGLEPARRLWRPVFVRPRGVLRHRRLCHRASCRCATASTPGSGFVVGIAAGALVGAVIGALSFRSGLQGSYFALVTLAFAEVLRIVASVAPITGAGVGTLIKLDLRPEAFQFQSRAPFYWIVLALVGVSLVLVRMIEDSRFGAYLVAVRENEDAARALGVDATMVKLGAMTISAAITAAAGCFYAQYFLFIDAGIAYGPWISIEALLAPIIGGIGTVFGPLLGALVVKTLGEADQARDRRRAGPRSRHLRQRADRGRRVRAARHRRHLRRPAPPVRPDRSAERGRG